MRGENSSELGYCILGVAGKLLEVLKKKKKLCKAETGLEELVSRHPFWCHDLAEVMTEGS